MGKGVLQFAGNAALIYRENIKKSAQQKPDALQGASPHGHTYTEL